jgi:hypothetical protein
MNYCFKVEYNDVYKKGNQDMIVADSFAQVLDYYNRCRAKNLYTEITEIIRVARVDAFITKLGDNIPYASSEKD